MNSLEIAEMVDKAYLYAKDKFDIKDTAMNYIKNY